MKFSLVCFSGVFCYSFYQPTILFYFVYVPIGAQEYTALQKRNSIRIDTEHYFV